MEKRKPIRYTVLYLLLALITAAAVILLSRLFSGFIKSKEASLAVIPSPDRVTFVIDAGHGGEDGGASADDGTMEKSLNLEISSALALIFELNGNDVRMTRTEDTLLYDYYNELENYKGKKKIYDLKNRVRIAKEYSDPIFISIHMNKFSDKRYSGLRVYYSKNNEKSYNFAASVQKNYATYVKKDDKTAVYKADSSIYVLNNLDCPAMLVECGFLSNDNEVEMLKSPEYRRSICLVIATGVLSGNIDN